MRVTKGRINMDPKLQDITKRLAREIKQDDNIHGGFLYLINKDSKAGSAIVNFKESELIFAAAYIISATAKMSGTSIEHTMSECQRCLDQYFFKTEKNLEN